jgi:hypothetical protein
MTINSNLRNKAFGIMQSIESMNGNEKNLRPSESYGLNYNNLRSLCINNNPELSEVMPPEVKFDDYGMGGEKLTVHNFSEIHTFCSEIYYLLNVEDA